MSITPMKRSKANIANLKELLHDNYSHNELNQRESRIESGYNEYSHIKDREIKEIVSDFKVLFSPDTQVPSFAITFDYLDKDIELHKIQISSVFEGKGKNSLFMDVKEFNDLLKQLNKEIKVFKKDRPSSSLAEFVNHSINNIFMSKEFDLDNEVEIVENSISSFLLDKENELGINPLKEEYKKNEIYINKQNKAVFEEIKETEDYIKLQAVKSKIDSLKITMSQLEKKVEADTTALELESLIPQTIKRNKIVKGSIESKESDINKGHESLLKNTNSIVRSKIKKYKQ